MQYDRSYISKIENQQEFPAVDFAKRTDGILAAGGAIRRAYKLAAQSLPGRSPRSDIGASVGGPHESGLLVELEEAELYYDHVNGNYRASQRRRIKNCGREPIYRTGT